MRLLVLVLVLVLAGERLCWAESVYEQKRGVQREVEVISKKSDGEGERDTAVNRNDEGDSISYVNREREGEGESTMEGDSKKEGDADATDSFCEMRWEGNRSSFCCFKGRSFGKCLPSVIIAGTQKSGTTALAAIMNTHPHVSFAKVKELHFFDRKKHFKKGITHYMDSFRFWNFALNSTVLPHFAEATPFYIASRHACRRISETVPEVKLIILLREPVARAYSEYQMKKRRVDSQNSFISLVHEHTAQLYDCLLQHPFKWSNIEKCVPNVIVDHEHWGKFFSSISRILKNSRKKLRATKTGSDSSSFTSRDSEHADSDNVEINEDYSKEEEGLTLWVEMMAKCFGSTPELYWEKPSKKREENKGNDLLAEEGDDDSDDSIDVSKSIRKLNGLIHNRTVNKLMSSQSHTDMLSFSNSLSPLPSLSKFSFDPFKKEAQQRSLLENPEDKWNQQWEWVNKRTLTDRYTHTSLNVSSSRKRNVLNNFFQPLACLASHAREALVPLVDAFENELEALNSCGQGKFVQGTLNEMDDSLDSCLTVHSGISNQYIYRSLYGVQIQHCLKFIPRDRILFLSSESLKEVKSASYALQKIAHFLNISNVDHHKSQSCTKKDDGNDAECKETSNIDAIFGFLPLSGDDLQLQINKTFPGFEKSSGWKLDSKYVTIPTLLQKKLASFFSEQNEKLYNLIGENFSDVW